jgi:hypothetical protein
MLTDEEFKAAKRELLSGLTGKERKAAAWWIDCLHKAGVPIQARHGRFPGPRDIVELRERLADEPEVLQVFEESYQLSKAEFNERLHAAGCATIQ